MSEIDPLGARLAIQNAQFALQKKQFVEARRLAMEAVRLDPDFEDPWLILAVLSSPEASVAYLQKALEINPHSERATKGMQWALERLSKVRDRDASRSNKTSVAPVSSIEPTPNQAEQTVPVIPAVSQRGAQSNEISANGDTQPVKAQTRQKVSPATAKLHRPAAKRKRNWGAVLLVLFFVLAVLAVAWFALPSWTALENSSSAPLPADVLDKPSLTPTETATSIPTSTATATPLPQPTETLIPTETPLPVDNESTDENSPYTPPAVGGNGEHWIDVDLTNQMLYAYEGDTVVASFLVSTGVAAYPTVTGQYHIYVKYLSTLMTGPGYYLPDVPYTMYFYEGYGIHGTYWHNNFGTPMSHGCVNMRTSDAEWVYNWASVGTLVNIHY